MRPEPLDPDERAALVQAAEAAVSDEGESIWWRSGFDELGGGPAPQEPWREAGVIQP